MNKERAKEEKVLRLERLAKASSSRPQNTGSEFKNQLYFYMLAMNNWKNETIK